MDRFEQHPLPAEMHVRLEADDHPRLWHRIEALVPRDRVGRNAQQGGVVARVFVEQIADRQPRLIEIQRVSLAEEEILHACPVQHPIVPHAGAEPV
ncbi:MAG: hypothetical protein HYZ58_12590 [Acidobacteria bacterium]|nr:hypothetical protein [Acidobacteriota bacterium]